jgi:aminopeptidase N
LSHRVACGHAIVAEGGAFPLPGDEPRYFRARPYSLDALDLTLDLDWETKEVAGVARLGLRRIDPEARWAALDAIAFEELSVSRDGEAAAFRYDGEILEVDLSDVAAGATAEIEVRYRCRPRRGLYFLGPDEADPDRPVQVWTQCQDQDGRHFFPCQDHPGQRMTTRLAVTAPPGMVALGNGVLEARVPLEEGERFVWTQKAPHPAYLFTLVIGAFEETHLDVGGLPVSYYVPAGQAEAVERSLGRTPEMIEVFAEKLGTPFPWDKYAQVVVSDFIFGGMENTSASTLFDRVLLDERAALDVDMESLVAHELAHQWFGDLVTCRQWSHAWLNEGFATFFEHVWKQHTEGEDAYLYNLEEDLEIYLSEVRGRYRRPVVERTYADPIDLFDRHLYQKGGLILHALRRELGEEAFWRGLKAYLARHRGGSVETRDLLLALEDETGRSLDGFFHQWIEKPGHPVVEVKVEGGGNGVVQVAVTQKQGTKKGELFRFGLPLWVVTEQGRTLHRLDVTRARETFAVPSKEQAVTLFVDPEMGLPFPLKPELPTAMLLKTLAMGEGDGAAPARSRWQAARVLAKRHEPRSADGLAVALAEDPSWMVRAEAAKALGSLRTDAAFAALDAGVADPHPKVRRAVAKALGQFREARAADRLLAWLDAEEPSYLVGAQIRRALGTTRDPRAVDALRVSLERDVGSWGDVVRSGAADGLAAMRDPAAIETLLTILGHVRTPATLRRAILGALSDVRDTTEDLPTLRRVREAARDRLDDFDPGVRITAVRLLGRLGDPRDRVVLDRVVDADTDGRVRRAAREARRTLATARKAPPEVASLRDEVSELSDTVAKLRDQIGRLAAREAAEDDAEGA